MARRVGSAAALLASLIFMSLAAAASAATPAPPESPCTNGLQPSSEREYALSDLPDSDVGKTEPNADQPTVAAACQAKFDEVEAEFCPGSERSQWMTQYQYSSDPTMCWLICCPKATPAPPAADTPAPPSLDTTPAPPGAETTPAPPGADTTPAPPGADTTGGDTPAPDTPGGDNGGGGDPAPPPPQPGPPPPSGSPTQCGANGFPRGSGENGAVMVYDCCTCYAGYKVSGPSGWCADCAEGYVRSANGVCTDGRPGSDCEDGADPPFGCGAGGKCGVSGSGRPAFPCAACGTAHQQGADPAPLDANLSSCQFYARDAGSGDIAGNVNDGMAGADNAKGGGCLPKGPRMMAPFPYHPLTGTEANGVQPFTLNVVGCDISDNDTFLVIPAFQWDEETGEVVRANLCEEVGVPPNVVPMPALTFDAGTKDALKVVDADGAQDGADGFVCAGCAKQPNEDQQGMVELVISNLQFTQADSLGKCPCAPQTASQGPGAGGKGTGKAKQHKAQALASNAGRARRGTPLGKKKAKGKGKTGKKGKWEMNEDENCPCDEVRHYRRMCYKMPDRRDINGDLQPLYRTIDAHNLYGWEGSTRYPAFYIGTSFEIPSMQSMIRGAAMGENALAEGDACCEGLLLGGELDSPCLPLWLFILIWLLLCLLLGLLACALHKNHKDIEAEKNNLKFSNFATDRELEEAGAGEGDDDDI